jgi:GMP synthase (glutamine-hydrolysing)
MPTPKKIAILITGDPPEAIAERHGDYADMMKAAIGEAFDEGDYLVVDPRRESLGADLDDAALVITGSSANVHHREPWMVAAEERLRELHAREVPMLGICFGHQLIAQALGGDVVPNPLGREMSTVEVRCVADDPLLRGLAEAFRANSCHSDTVSQLPKGTTVLGISDGDPHQILRFGRRNWGVQFHPEFDGEVMGLFVDARAEAIVDEGLDVHALRARARDTPDALAVFRNFVATWRSPS